MREHNRRGITQLESIRDVLIALVRKHWERYSDQKGREGEHPEQEKLAWQRPVLRTIVLLFIVVIGLFLYQWLMTQRTIKPLGEVQRATERAVNQASFPNEETRQRNRAAHAPKVVEPAFATAETQTTKLGQERKRATNSFTKSNTPHRLAKTWRLTAQADLVLVSQSPAVEWSVFLATESLRRPQTYPDTGVATGWSSSYRRRLATLGHESAVNAVAFSRDGTRLATASDDHTARLWEVASGKELARLPHESYVTAVAFSPDGTRVATVSRGRWARLWEVASGKELARLTHQGNVLAVAFSPNGTRLATASDDRTARLWEATSGMELTRLTHPGKVTAVAFSPDGNSVATASDDQMARLWEVTSGKELARFTHQGTVVTVAFSRDGTRLATASGDGTARLWEVASGKELARFTHQGMVRLLALSPDGAYVATSYSREAFLWDAATGKELAVLPHCSSVDAIAFSPDGASLATASKDRTVILWEVAPAGKSSPS